VNNLSKIVSKIQIKSVKLYLLSSVQVGEDEHELKATADTNTILTTFAIWNEAFIHRYRTIASCGKRSL